VRHDEQNEQAKNESSSSLFLIISGVCVGAAVAFGLWIMPSPLAQREIELDKQRSRIDCNRGRGFVLSAAKGKIPTALSALPGLQRSISPTANDHSLRYSLNARVNLKSA